MNIELKEGKFNEAENYLLQAKTIQEKTISNFHPNFLQTLQYLSSLYLQKKEVKSLLALFPTLIEGQQLLIQKSAPQLAALHLQQFLYQWNSTANRLYTFIKSYPEEAKSLLALAYNCELFYKNYVQQNSIKRQRILENVQDTAVQKIRKEYQEAQQQLSTLFTQYSPDKRLLQQLEIKNTRLEIQLAKLIPNFENEQQVITWKTVQQKLNVEDNAIEFIHFEDQITKSVTYAALLVKKEANSPIFIELCKENALDSLLVSAGAKKADYAERLYPQINRGMKPQANKIRSLRELIWQPLAPHLLPKGHIFYALTGVLHRICLDAISVEPNTTLADKFLLHRLISTASIEHNKPAFEAKSALIYSDVNFDEAANSDSSIPTLADINTRNAASEGNKERWEALSWTADEGQIIERFFKEKNANVTAKNQSQANESFLKSTAHNNNHHLQVIHFATHGYFFSIDNTLSQNNLLGESIFKASNHPLIRSGLILAGANKTWANNNANNREDGILTAYEISTLSLYHTDLVTLSACETGLGDIDANMGVAGLQSAFKIAGVKHIIMSLWQVPDFQTQDLMTTFYEFLLYKKMNIHDAFYQTQQKMREKYHNPYFWAGFVLIE